MRHAVAILLAIGLVAVGGAAQAQRVTVRGGEHADFTRLVFPLPQGQGWELRQDGRSAVLRINDPQPEFDLSHAFDLIPRTRLAELHTRDDGLELALGCDCIVTATQHLPPFVVIDILSPPPQASGSATPAMRPPPRPGDTAAPAPEPVPQLAARTAGHRLAQLMTGRASPTQTSILPSLHGLAPPPAPPVALAAEEAADLGAAAEIAHAIAQAVDHGLLDGDAAIAAPASPPKTAPPDAAHWQGSHIALSDAIAIARGDPAHSPQRPAAMACPDARLLNPARWEELLGDHDPLQDIPHLPATLYSELDAISPETVTRTALHWLSLGFGAEARQILSLAPETSAETAFLRAISYLIDLEPLPEDGSDALFDTCPGGSDLWAVLAMDPQATSARTEFRALPSAIAALPRPLRLHLGPHVIRRLLALGEHAQAHAIRDMLERIAGETSPALRVALAALDLPRADAGERRALEDALRKDASVEGVLFLLQQRAEIGAMLEPGLIADAEMHLIAHRGTATGQALARLLALGLARSDSFAEAFALLHSRDAALSETRRAELFITLMRKLVLQADDANFTVINFAQTPWAQALPDDLRAALAARLAGLGFEDQAALMRRAAPTEAEAITPEDDSGAALEIAPQDARPTATEGAEAAPQAPPDMPATPDTEQADPGPAPAPAMTPPIAAMLESQGLLESGYASIEASSALRSRLQDLLQDPDP